MKNCSGAVLRDFSYGMIGGVVGTIVLEKVGGFLYRFESEEKKKIEESLREKVPPLVLAERISDGLDLKLSESRKSALAQGIHWGTGVVFGGLYGVLRDRVPFISKAAGLPYGLAFSLLVDEGLNSALKLTPPPREFPVDAHVRGLATHAAYAFAVDRVYAVMRRFFG